MKPHEDIDQLRKLISDPNLMIPQPGPESPVVRRAGQLLQSLKRTAKSRGEKIDADAHQQLANLDFQVLAFLGLPVEPPLTRQDLEKAKLAILGILETLDRYFHESNFNR